MAANKDRNELPGFKPKPVRQFIRVRALDLCVIKAALTEKFEAADGRTKRVIRGLMRQIEDREFEMRKNGTWR